MMNGPEHLFFGILVLFYSILYSLKLLITQKINKRSAALFLYAILVIASLLFLYLVVVDWKNHNETALLHWIGIPIDFLFIPTCTFLSDLFATQRKTIKFLIIRSIIEVFILFPLWFVFMFFVFGRLGWFWL